jgi:tRNA(Ile)-lysidine synthase
MAASRNKFPSSPAAELAGFLEARLGPADVLCVGLSGGCDSVVLLHAAAALGLGDRLCALHVNHGLSPRAGIWADFCATLCMRLGISLNIESVAVDRASGLGIEAAARNARYAAFSRCAAHVLLLGHQRDDQAETLLFNLLRGCGISGAAAIREERAHGGLRILRPLLGLPRSAIEAYAFEHGLEWIHDESNDDTALARGFLRREVFPLLAGRFPGGDANLARAAGHFAEAAGLLDELAALDWASAAAGEALRLVTLRTLSPARQANLLRYRLRHLGWQAPAAVRLVEFCRQLQTAGPDRHPELALPEGRMHAGRGLLHWEPAK